VYVARVLVSLALAALSCAAGADAAGGRDTETIRLGQGLGSWRIGQRPVVRPGRVRSERFPANDGPGCSSGPETASRIDYYPGVRVSWSGFRVPWIKGGFLSDVATMRAGDRSGDGFVIGESTLRAVRAAHFRARVARPRGRYVLGRTALTVHRRTGEEAFSYFTYWFDRAGTLTAMQTGVGGC
jgi:hypothetical protein